MEFRLVGPDESPVAVAQGEGVLVATPQDMLDMIATAAYLHGSSRLVLHRRSINPAFFDLKTGLAGEALQKVINYGAALAIVGDFDELCANSKALRDFIYESNQSSRVFFLPGEEAAVEKLLAAGQPQA